MAAFSPTAAKHLWQLPLQGHDWPLAVAFAGSSRRVVAATRTGVMVAWDLPDDDTAPAIDDQQKTLGVAPAPTLRLVGHENGVTRLAATPDGKLLVSASIDRTVRLWDVAAAPQGDSQLVLDAELRKNESRRSGKKELLDEPGVALADVGPVATLEGHRDWIDALGLSRDGRRIISGDQSALVIVWDLAERRETARWSGHGWNWIVAAGLSPDGATALVSEYRYKRDDFDLPAPALKLWSVADAAEQLDLLKLQLDKFDAASTTYGSAQVWRKFVRDGLIAVDFSPDGRLFAAAQGGETDTGHVHLFEAETGKLLRTVSGHQYGVCDVRFSPDGQYILSSGRDTTVRVCQVADGKEVLQLGQPRGGQFKDWLSAFAISPDGRYIAAADIAGWVQVWRLGE